MKKCVIYRTMDLIGKKWSLLIILEIYKKEKMGFNELKRALEDITPRMLSMRLEDLKKHGLVQSNRIEESNKKEYKLTKPGRDLIKPINQIKEWSLKWLYPEEECYKDCKDCYL